MGEVDEEIRLYGSRGGVSAADRFSRRRRFGKKERRILYEHVYLILDVSYRLSSVMPCSAIIVVRQAETRMFRRSYIDRPGPHLRSTTSTARSGNDPADPSLPDRGTGIPIEIASQSDRCPHYM